MSASCRRLPRIVDEAALRLRKRFDKNAASDGFVACEFQQRNVAAATRNDPTRANVSIRERRSQRSTTSEARASDIDDDAGRAASNPWPRMRAHGGIGRTNMPTQTGAEAGGAALQPCNSRD
ncbi:hypothetical protein [Lysobacter enzymogenes]|uniref:hypothetical protein n=1 Tax=Lysobacter enzymogenes TaxID=69 RepID=UPI0011170B68|nr:hypothetical protein [Lysobacter enzymogenes]UZW60889.1 hypothetical protein BV903_000960 [Lysobacter enzymogenes]